MGSTALCHETNQVGMRTILQDAKVNRRHDLSQAKM
jgi:hypothetical protein